MYLNLCKKKREMNEKQSVTVHCFNKQLLSQLMAIDGVLAT